MNPIRIGLIVPSSNSTMETEIPAMLRAREGVAPERFTFHSSRMRMRSVSKELNLPTFVPNAGALLSGRSAAASARSHVA